MENKKNEKKKKSKTNPGKLFENRFRSFFVKRNIFVERLKDPPKGLFGVNNKADFIVFMKRNLYLFECKSHKGISLPNSCISPNQIKSLILESKKQDVYSYLIIELRDKKVIYAIDINKVFYLTEYLDEKNKIKYNTHCKLDRASIPLSFLEKEGVLLSEKNRLIEEFIFKL